MTTHEPRKVIGRYLGIDYGTRRIGLAQSDPRGVLVSPAGTLPSAGSASHDADAVARWAGEHEIASIVVGLPLNMDGTDSDQTRLTRRFVEHLRQRTTLPVEIWDERLTSFQADTLLANAGVKPRRQRELRDTLAAHIILESFLAARRGPEPA